MPELITRLQNKGGEGGGEEGEDGGEGVEWSGGEKMERQGNTEKRKGEEVEWGVKGWGEDGGGDRRSGVNGTTEETLSDVRVCGDGWKGGRRRGKEGRGKNEEGKEGRRKWRRRK